MLSYLKDNQSQIPAASGTPDNPAGSESELSRQEDFLTVSGHGQKLRQSTILLIVVFGVAVLGVWFMIKKTTPAEAMTAADNQTQLEAAIAQLNGMQTEMNSQMNSVVGRFYQVSTVGQVGVEELKKNPFRRESGGGMAGEQDDFQQRLRMEDRARRAATGLELWSITTTPRGICCMINDKVLYVGDEINGMTVTRIENKVVTLDLDGVGLQLKMDE